MDWLEEELGGYDDDYLIFDCPGQIELYTHHPFLPTLVQNLSRIGMRTCAVYLLESQFMEDRYKFFSGVLSAMSAMVNLEIPWINIMSKMDLVTENTDDPSGGARNGIRGRKNIARYLDPDPLLLATARGQEANASNPRFHALNQAIVQLVRPSFILLCSYPGSFPAIFCICLQPNNDAVLYPRLKITLWYLSFLSI